MKSLIEERRAHSRLFEEVIVKSWWVLLLFMISYFIFDQAMKRREQEAIHLRKKLSSLIEEMEQVEKEQEELKLEIASQDDPLWIEMTLMRGLGLVPEGETKVHFSQSP